MEMVDKDKVTRSQNPLENCDHKLKIVLVGSKGSGKTSFLRRITEDLFNDKYIPTMSGTSSNIYYTTNTDKYIKNIKVSIWDTAGEERFFSLTKNYFSQSNAVLILYDTTDINSWKQVPIWLNMIDERGDINTLVFLVGTKKDLFAERKVNLEEVETYLEVEGNVIKGY